jgi:hypothetical protein
VLSRAVDLFDEYAAAYARGERPDAEDFLQRAGDERRELASLLDEFLRRAPVPAPTEDDVRLLGLMLAEEPPLLALRVRRGITVDDVVSAVIGYLGLDPAKRLKVKRYYQRLEGGLLDPSGVDRRVRAVLTDVLGASADAAMSWTAPPMASTAFLRHAELAAAPPSAAAPAPVEAEEDEIDRLFTGGDEATTTKGR